MDTSLDSHRFSEVPRLVDVGSQDKRSVVRKKLQRQRENERATKVGVSGSVRIAQAPGAPSDAPL